MPRAALPSGRKLLLLLALAAAIAGAWWWTQPHPPPDPIYQGERLSQWVATPGVWRKIGGGTMEAARQHFHRFGPDGITWLAYQVEHGRQPFVKNGPLPFDHAPHWLARCVPERWGGLRSDSSGDERANAALALRLLGPEAAPAVPALVRSLNHAETELYASFIATALHAIGPAAWPAVHDALEHGSTSTRIALISNISERASGNKEPEPDAEVERIFADLMKAAADTDPKVRAIASYGIGFYRFDRPYATHFEAAIPELILLLSDPDPEVRQGAAVSIGRFGAKGAGATERLIELLDDPSRKTRIIAVIALSRVDQSEKLSSPRLRVLLRDPDSHCRSAAARALQDLGLPPDEATADPNVLPQQ